MGGDFAPKTTVGGAVKALHVLPKNFTQVLFGDQEIIISLLAEHNVSPDNFEIVQE